MEMSSGSSLRDRKKRAVRDAAADAALTLFAAQGYDATTVSEIAARAGMSPRTFFRYFSGKDELITHTFAAIGEDVVTALSRRPPQEGPWMAVRRAFDPLIEQLERDERGLVIMRIIYDTPVLYARHLEKQTRWRQAIGAGLLERPSTTIKGRLEAESIAAASLSCLEAARSEWVRENGADRLSDLLDVAMAAVSPLH
jgi:AcrR family transcriptional regulator